MKSTSSGITKLSLNNFRNYDSYSLNTELKPIVLVGRNGVGKTNILEAISMLVPGRGLRRARIGEMVNFNKTENPWVVRAELTQDGIDQNIATAIDPDAMAVGKEKRIAKLNGENVKSQAVLNELMHITWLTPQMDRMFIDPASGRRQFFDRLVFGLDSAHVTRLRKYEHYMRERAKLLRDRNFNDKWLSLLENGLAEAGVAIACARRDYAAQLNTAIDSIPSSFPKAYLQVCGEIDDVISGAPALAAEENSRQIFANNRRVDSESGTTKFGAHRSDVETKYMPTGRPAAICSTGEQKALMISIILASVRVQAMWGSAMSILLLDEVVAHLDDARRMELYNDITNLPMQTWITGTEASVFEPIMSKCQMVRL